MKSTIILENGQSIELPVKVIQTKQFDKFVIVLTDSNEKNVINNENVYCYDFEGNRLWQITDLNLFHEKHDYTSIYTNNSELYIYNRCGIEVKIVPETGEILSKELIK